MRTGSRRSTTPSSRGGSPLPRPHLRHVCLMAGRLHKLMRVAGPPARAGERMHQAAHGCGRDALRRQRQQQDQHRAVRAARAAAHLSPGTSSLTASSQGCAHRPALPSAASGASGASSAPRSLRSLQPVWMERQRGPGGRPGLMPMLRPCRCCHPPAPPRPAPHLAGPAPPASLRCTASGTTASGARPRPVPPAPALGAAAQSRPAPAWLRRHPALGSAARRVGGQQQAPASRAAPA